MERKIKIGRIVLIVQIYLAVTLILAGDLAIRLWDLTLRPRCMPVNRWLWNVLDNC